MVKDKYDTNLYEVVISVPAEFDYLQRNYTEKAVELAGILSINLAIFSFISLLKFFYAFLFSFYLKNFNYFN